MFYKASAFSDFFIRKAIKNKKYGENMTNPRLQKLLYYSYAWYLALYDKDLFSEPIHAGEHGAYVRSEDKAFKQYNSKSIPKIALISQETDLIVSLFMFLEVIWNIYGRYSATKLRMMNINESPWIRTKNREPKEDGFIYDHYIKEYFTIERYSSILPADAEVINAGTEYARLICPVPKVKLEPCSLNIEYT